jgi:hypothetical protein
LYLLILFGCLGQCRTRTGWLPIHTATGGWSPILVA